MIISNLLQRIKIGCCDKEELFYCVVREGLYKGDNSSEDCRRNIQAKMKRKKNLGRGHN